MFIKTFVIIFCILTASLGSTRSFLHSHRGHESNTEGSPMKIIIDTDAGGDDAVAILLALASDKVQVVAITCVYGNTDEVNVQTNVLKILTMANRTDIPVYSGAKKPLVQSFESGDYFGKDGFGDFEFDREILGTVDVSKNASTAMIDLAKRYAGDISVVVLGPSTNVAIAATLDPQFTKNVRRFYVMGSQINEPGNNDVEFNFSLDPESNAILLNSSMNIESVVTPYDTVLRQAINKEWRTEVLGKLDSERIRFLNKVEGVVLEKLDKWFPADSIAVATMIWPDLITTSLLAHMTPVTSGEFKGSVIVESNVPQDQINVDIIRNINITAFQDRLLQYLA